MINMTLSIYVILVVTLMVALTYCLYLRRQLATANRQGLLFQACHHPWLICNEKLEVVEANQYARVIFGDNCHQQTLAQLLDQPLAAIKGLIQDHHNLPAQLSRLYLVGNGDCKCWVTISVTLTLDRHYSILLTCAERQKELEHSLIKENIWAAKGQCYAGLLHEIGNPIAAIDGMLSELHQQVTGLSEQQNKYFELLESQLERINRIRYKTAILSSQNNNHDVDELYSLNEHLTGLTELLAFDKRATATKLLLALDSTMPAIQLNQDKLTQIVINLISNSLDASQNNDNAEIKISTSYQQGQLELKVSDNGCGMTPEIKCKAMQAHFSTKQKGKGSGLGLSICNTLTAELGGKIEIFSNQNTGTQVSLSFRLQE